MKNTLRAFVLCAGVMLSCLGLLLTAGGCKSSTGSMFYNVKRDAKYKLDGISKIGIIEFNSLHDQQNKIAVADRESVQMAQELITMHFKSNPKYDLVNFDMERDIAAQGSVRPQKRLDGLLYGQVWYQITPEFQGIYPKLFKLVDTAKIHYQEVSPDSSMRAAAKTLPLHAHDHLESMYFRSKRGTAIVSLSLYRLDNNGVLTKVLDLIETASKVYTMDNGVGSKDFFITDLSVKQELINAAARKLLDQLLPQDVSVAVHTDFSDSDLHAQFLTSRRPPEAIIDFCVKHIIENSGAEVAARIPTLEPYLKDQPRNVNAKVKDEDIQDAIEDNEEHLLAIAICEEGMGKTARALETYRMLMHKIEKPDHCVEIAAGMARCIAILGIKQQSKKDFAKHEKTIKKFN